MSCELAAMHIDRIDHLVLTVRDIEATAAGWMRAGFVATPRGSITVQVLIEHGIGIGVIPGGKNRVRYQNVKF